METKQGRVDSSGRAFAGSQLQMQIYANQKSDELTRAIIVELGLDPLVARIEWRSPLEKTKYAEPKDAAFLEAAGIADAAASLAEFWPLSGPRWDGLGLLHTGTEQPTILLVEAKSYPKEIFGSGCTASHPDSVSLIDRSLDRAKEYFGISPETDWKGGLYQYANRLAHLHFLREKLGRNAVLINLCFTGDRDPRTTTRADWDAALQDVKSELGFTGGAVPHTVDVFLPCLSRDVLTA